MIIELPDCLLEVFFQHAQIEITGRCNMRCKHCRAWDEARVDLDTGTIIRILDFLTSERDADDLRLTISGGEPFMRRDLTEIVGLAKNKGIENIIITTNGSLVTEKKIQELIDLGVDNLSIQVSVDSHDSAIHDEFRGFKGAFQKAIKTLKLVAAANLTSSLRTTVTPKTIGDINKLIDLGLLLGVERIGIGSVIPAGRGKDDASLLMSPQQKKQLINTITTAKKMYPHLDITTEDPLKFALGDSIWEYGDFDIEDDSFFCGCTAGVTGFNADSEGVITPCAVLLEPVVKVTNQSTSELIEAYTKSPVIVSLLSRNYSGKCGSCRLKRLCGGCRAVAKGVHGDFLGEDTTCWL